MYFPVVYLQTADYKYLYTHLYIYIYTVMCEN